MFTGIVAGRARVRSVRDADGLRELRLTLPTGLGAGLATGASVAVAGTCLTVVEHDGDEVRFDCIDETLRLTTLGALGAGDEVNVERAARFGDEIGGHALSGHVMGALELLEREEVAGNLTLRFRAPAGAVKYLLPKGYVAVDGCSLTIGAVDPAAATFTVHLIPETRRLTTLDALRPGGRCNLEVDASTQAVVDTVERALAARTLEPKVHRSRLAGFIFDCEGTDPEGAAAFWSAALGMQTLGADGPSYVRLDGSARDLAIEVQRVEHPSRVHVDLEADDVDAEADRLEALGARRVRKVRTWWVMEAPTGHRFCVVQGRDLAGRPGVNVWRR